MIFEKAFCTLIKLYMKYNIHDFEKSKCVTFFSSICYVISNIYIPLLVSYMHRKCEGENRPSLSVLWNNAAHHDLLSPAWHGKMPWHEQKENRFRCVAMNTRVWLFPTKREVSLFMLLSGRMSCDTLNWFRCFLYTVIYLSVHDD